jgi:hypothetical protein
MRGPNKLRHIFANRRHNLGPLVRQYGSREAAGLAIQDAVDAALQTGKLTPNARGVFEIILDIGGHPVTVRGVILQGTAQLGTAWIPPHPWGWSVELGALGRTRRRLAGSVFLPPGDQRDNDA